KPFYRADVNREQSAGMGLSITRRLGERLGWPGTLESLPGEGTLATIRFTGRRGRATKAVHGRLQTQSPVRGMHVTPFTTLCRDVRTSALPTQVSGRR